MLPETIIMERILLCSFMLLRLLLQCGKLFFEFFLLPLADS